MDVTVDQIRDLMRKVAILLTLWSLVSVATALVVLLVAPRQVIMWLVVAGIQLTAGFVLGAIAVPEEFIKLKGGLGRAT